MVRFFISTSKGLSAQELRLQKRNLLLLSHAARCRELLKEIRENRWTLEQKIKRCA